MSIHRSLATKSSLVRARNVLTRHERILQLRKSGKWKEEESSPYGLPKVRVLRVKARGKPKKEKEAAAPGAPAGAAPQAAPAQAPAAAGAKASQKPAKKE
ncbi:MAG: small basic protein [Planctomycetota bacterium]